MNRFVWEESDFNEILKSDDIEKANPYHDELGRFTFAPAGKSGRSISAGVSHFGPYGSVKIEYGELEFDVITDDIGATEENWYNTYSNWSSWEGNFRQRHASAAFMGLASPDATGDEHGSEGANKIVASGKKLVTANAQWDINAAQEAITDAYVGLKTVANAEPTTMQLHRGMSVKPNAQVLKMKVGQEFSMPLTAFSYDQETALSFSRRVEEGDTQVLIVLRKGARAANAPSDFNTEIKVGREWVEVPIESVTQGKFRVVGKRVVKGNSGDAIAYEIEQVSVFDPSIRRFIEKAYGESIPDWVWNLSGSFNNKVFNLSKANPYHDELGRFTFAPDGARTSVPKRPPIKRKTKTKSKVKLGEVNNKDLDDKARKVLEQTNKKLKTKGISESPVAAILVNEQMVAEDLEDLTRMDFSEGGDIKPEVIKSMFEVKEGDYSSEVTELSWSGNKEKNQGSIEIHGVVQKKGFDNAVGSFSRTIVVTNGLIERVSHDVFKMEDGHQGSGFGAVFFANSVSHYQELGASYITTHANIDIGGYAWAKAGFEFSGDPTEYTHDLAVDVNRLAGRLLANRTSSNIKVSDIIEEKMKIMRYEVESLSPIDQKRYALAMKKAEATLAKSRKEILKIQSDFEDYTMPADQNYQPIDFANIGIKQAVEILMPVRKTGKDVELIPIKTWIGKMIMLGSDWEGELYIGD